MIDDYCHAVCIDEHLYAKIYAPAFRVLCFYPLSAAYYSFAAAVYAHLPYCKATPAGFICPIPDHNQHVNPPASFMAGDFDACFAL